MCHWQCREEGFNHIDIASVMVEEAELHTITLCKDCLNLRQSERKELVVNSRLWKLPVAELAVGLGARGLEQKTREICAGKKMYWKRLLTEAAAALSLGKEWLDVSPHKGGFTVPQESNNFQLPGMMVRKGVKVGRADEWWDLMKSEGEPRGDEDDQRKSIVQKVMRRIIAPVQVWGDVTRSCVCPHCHRFSLEDQPWWVSTGSR